MSDRDRADYYRLQAAQAQMTLKEVFVLFTSKVRQLPLYFLVSQAARCSGLAFGLFFACRAFMVDILL